MNRSISYTALLALVTLSCNIHASLSLQEANNLLHQGICENDPAMVKQAFDKGARAIDNPRNNSKLPLLEATGKLIQTCHEREQSFDGAIFRNALLLNFGIDIGIAIARTHRFGREAKCVCILATAMALPALFHNLVNVFAQYELNKHQKIIDLILAKGSNCKFALVSSKAMEVNKLAETHGNLEILTYIKSLGLLDAHQESLENNKQEILKARNKIYEHYLKAIGTHVE